MASTQAIINQANSRPISPKQSTVGVMTSGSSYTTPYPTKVIVALGTATTITLGMLDGTSVNIGTCPIGVYQFDMQVEKVTLGAAANGVISGFTNVTD